MQKAEIVKALLILISNVDSNYSFASAKDKSEKFKTMCKSYQEDATISKCNIQFGVASYFKNGRFMILLISLFRLNLQGQSPQKYKNSASPSWYLPAQSSQ